MSSSEQKTQHNDNVVDVLDFSIKINLKFFDYYRFIP